MICDVLFVVLCIVHIIRSKRKSPHLNLEQEAYRKVVLWNMAATRWRPWCAQRDSSLRRLPRLCSPTGRLLVELVCFSPGFSGYFDAGSCSGVLEMVWWGVKLQSSYSGVITGVCENKHSSEDEDTWDKPLRRRRQKVVYLMGHRHLWDPLFILLIAIIIAIINTNSCYYSYYQY